MKIVSLLPPEDSEQPEDIITVNKRSITIEVDEKRTLKVDFDKIFKTAQGEAKFIKYDRPSAFICVCTPDMFCDKNGVKKTIEALAGQALAASEEDTCRLSMTLYSAEKSDVIKDEEFNTAIACADLVDSQLEDNESDDSIVVSFRSENVVFDAFFISASSSQMAELEERTHCNPPIDNEFVNNLITIVRSSPEVVADFRFGHSKEDNALCANCINSVRRITPDWINFVCVPVRGPDGKKMEEDGRKVMAIDKSRLMMRAKSCAEKSNSREELETYISEMLVQKGENENIGQFFASRLAELTKTAEYARNKEKKLSLKESCLKQHLVELKVYNKSNENAQKSAMIGDDDDYVIAKECLEEEVQALEKELDFLRLAFPDVNEEEDSYEEEDVFDAIDAEEEEEEEEKLEVDEEEEKQEEVKIDSSAEEEIIDAQEEEEN